MPIVNCSTGEIVYTQEEIDAIAAGVLKANIPEFITRRQCALQLLAMGAIASQEALGMTKTAAVPSAISAVFDAQVASGAWTAEQRTLAEIDFAAVNYYRSNSLLGLMGLTSEQIDQFFIEAGKL